MVGDASIFQPPYSENRFTRFMAASRRNFVNVFLGFSARAHWGYRTFLQRGPAESPLQPVLPVPCIRTFTFAVERRAGGAAQCNEKTV